MTVTLMMWFNQSMLFISNIQKSLGIDSGWMIDSVIGYNISLILYTSLLEAVMSNYQKN